MSLISVSIAAASAPIGTNLLADTVGRQDGRVRQIKKVAITGSAAALDTRVRLMVGSMEVGPLYNSATGAPQRDYLFETAALVPANTEIGIFVEDAPATNPINVLLETT